MTGQPQEQTIEIEEQKALSLRDMLLYVAWSQDDFDRASADVKVVRDAMNAAVNRMKKVTQYDTYKANLEDEKKLLVEFMIEHPPETKRTTVPDVGWVDVTPQPDTVTVSDLMAFLADPSYHDLVKSVTLTDDAIAQIRSGRPVDGVRLEPASPSVRMSVKEFLDKQKES